MWKVLTFALLIIVSTANAAQHANKPVINLQSLQKSTWTDQELANATLMVDFVQNLMNNHDFNYIQQQYDNSSYVQHNRNLPDKIAGLVGFLKEFVEDYPEYSYDVKHIYVDGDYVIFHSHATLEKSDRGNDEKGMNIIDTWRIEDGKIVEHWDSIQALDTFMRFYSLVSGGNIQNNNGVF